MNNSDFIKSAKEISAGSSFEKMNISNEYNSRVMHGFVDQAGRLPTPEDHCRFMYLGGNGIKRWFTQFNDNSMDATFMISECCLQVL